jgi:hypothetical protein
VTAELAAGLPVVVILLMVGLSGISALVSKVRCVDAAREGALTASRGGDGVAAAVRAAPRGAVVAVRTEGDLIRAEIRAQVRPLGPHLPGFDVDGTAVAAREPDAAP